MSSHPIPLPLSTYTASSNSPTSKRDFRNLGQGDGGGGVKALETFDVLYPASTVVTEPQYERGQATHRSVLTHRSAGSTARGPSTHRSVGSTARGTTPAGGHVHATLGTLQQHTSHAHMSVEDYFPPPAAPAVEAPPPRPPTPPPPPPPETPTTRAHNAAVAEYAARVSAGEGGCRQDKMLYDA